MPSTGKPFPEVKKGDKIRADAWNDLQRQVVRLSNIGGGGQHILATGAGTFVRGVVAPGAQVKLGQTTTAHAKDATETVNLHTGDTPGSETASGSTVEAFNRLNAEIASGTWVYLLKVRGSTADYEIIADVSEIIKIGILDGALAAATNALDTPATATLSVYTYSAGDLVDSGDNITVTNRYTEVDAIASGTLMMVRKFGSEWWPITADCGATTIA